MESPGSGSLGMSPANRVSQPPTNLELRDRIQARKSALSKILEETKWPPESANAAHGLLQTIIVVNIPPDATAVEDAVERYIQYIRVLEHVSNVVGEASKRYGMRQRGVLDMIKYRLSAHRKCTNLLRSCREDIDRALLSLPGDNVNIIHSVRSGGPGGPTKSSSPLSLVQSGGDSSAPESTLSPTANVDNRPPIISKHQGSLGLPEDRPSRSPVPESVLTAARETFSTVQIGSGAIPEIGNFVEVAAEVGLGFVNIIVALDKSDGITEELASHTSRLSTFLKPFNRTSDDVEELNTRLNDLLKELADVQQKVYGWHSLGRLSKVFLQRDNAESLKSFQDTVQTVLEQLQLLVSLKTRDLVIQFKDSGRRRRLLNLLGDGQELAMGSSIEKTISFPRTRMDLLHRIDDWIRDTSTLTERVLWIRGMAGRGKTTIASAVARRWSSKGSCAIFHFRLGQSASSGRFICSLARQLGQSLVPEVKDAILEGVMENKDIATERLDHQFQILFVGSLGKLYGGAYPIVIIVDALDEYNDRDAALRFIHLIHQHSPFLPSNLKFLLTCRPEPLLLAKLEPKEWRVENLDLMVNLSDDITRYLEHCFAQIKNERHLPSNWPKSADLEDLVQMSQGLFQWARTAMVFIRGGSPESRLQELLQKRSAWSGLYDLYHHILSRAFKNQETDTSLLSWVLGTLVVTPYPVSLEVIAFLQAEHQISKGRKDPIQFLREDVLADLNPVLHIPTSPSEPMRLMHTSVCDFLLSREQCEKQPYFVDPIQQHQRLAGLTLQIMETNLQKDICKLSDVSKGNPGASPEVGSHVPAGLCYCCHSWSTHLTSGLQSGTVMHAETTPGVLAKFQTVSEEKLLFWLEVMSFIGATSEAHKMAKQVHEWLQQRSPDTANTPLLTLWNDAQRFIVTFSEPISFNPLQIYASALPHCPTKTSLWTSYRDQAATRILLGKQHQNWAANIWARSANSPVIMVKFSPGGTLLASGLGDGKIRFWDPETGAPLGDPLTGHSDSVTSIIFSPDGKILASSSGDGTLRLWDGQTGGPVGDPLIGHSGSITSVIFSPDGQVLASGSNDETVRLWDVQTGAPLGEPLTGHHDWVRSVTFSPDGKVLASGSDDSTVRLWDAQTGAALGEPLTGHYSWVRSVTFSPDGKTLASGSNDRTVRLWDVGTGAPVGEPLTGHNDSITSIIFSPDGKVLASSSDDGAVRLWDMRTGRQFGVPLTDRKTSITCVVFSPDAKVLASGSSDGTVQFWDPWTGTKLGNPQTGHSNRIRSIAFSPNAKVLASGSDDKTIRLWDVQTGALLSEPPTGHNEGVRCIGFSPDGKILASGSDDRMVRLWDAQTGRLIGEPLSGHSDSVTSVIFSSGGKVLASVSDDTTIRVWDAHSGAALGGPLKGHRTSIRSIAFSPDGKVLASGSDDATVRLWDPQTGTPFGDALNGHGNSITSVVFSPNGEVLASASDDKTVRLWEVQTRVQLGTALTGHKHSITSVAFSPDGKILASSSDDRTVRLWDIQTGQSIGSPLGGHSGKIKSVIFSIDGKVLATGFDNATVQFWDLVTRQPLDGPSNNFASRLVGIQSNWVVCDSKRLVWLPPQYQSESPSIGISPLGMLAGVFGGGLLLQDVSQILWS